MRVLKFEKKRKNKQITNSRSRLYQQTAPNLQKYTVGQSQADARGTSTGVWTRGRVPRAGSAKRVESHR